MGRSRYKIYEAAHPHCVTCTVLHWLPQIWEEGHHPQLIQSDAMMINKIQYIHANLVKRGCVDDATDWRYSSARNYEGIDGLLEIGRFW